MSDPVYTERPEDLIRAAAAAGFSGIAKAQLVRWHRFDLLPRPKQRSLGRGRGTETLYPRGSAERVPVVCELLRRRRNFDYVREELWWRGFEVKREYIRNRLEQAAAWGLGDVARIRRPLRPYLRGRETRELFEKLVRALEPEAITRTLREASYEQIEQARDEIRVMVAGGPPSQGGDRAGTKLRELPLNLPPWDKLSSDEKVLLLVRWLSLRQLPELRRWHALTILLTRIEIWSLGAGRV